MSSTVLPTCDSAADVLAADLAHLVGDLREVFQRMAGQSLLITGGAGFLGYYLVQAVTAWNRHSEPEARIDLTVYDNFARGRIAWLTELADAGQLRLVRHNMIQPLPHQRRPFQWIVHAAGIASPTYYRLHPLETMDANINGLRNLLDYCRAQADRNQPVESLLFFSSSEIYGDPPPDQVPTAEAYRGHVSCTGPRACYDESKRYGETLCVVYARHYGVNVKMVRPFNNYGPGLKITDRRVIPDLARNVLENRPLVLLSDGSPKRTFCYVADAVCGYYRALVRGLPGEPYNIGVERPEISMHELARRLATVGRTLFNYQGDVVRQHSSEPDYLVDNPVRRCPDIGKARRQLGYNPAIDLDEGLRRSLLWYAGHRQAEEG